MPSVALDQLKSKALELNESDRAELAHDLIASLDGAPDLNAADAWDKEILRRLNQVEDGTAKSIDRAALRERLRNRAKVR